MTNRQHENGHGLRSTIGSYNHNLLIITGSSWSNHSSHNLLFYPGCSKNFYNGISVRSNTRYVHRAVTPSAAWQLNRRLCPHRGKKGVWRPYYCV